MPAPTMTPLMSPRDLAKWLGVSVDHLATLRSRGGGPPFVMVGGAVRYAPHWVARWLEEQQQTTTRRRRKEQPNT